MMEIINKRHDEISYNPRELPVFIRFDRNYIYFSAGAAEELGLQPGLNVNFINDGDEWLFYCDNNEDGFPLAGYMGQNAMVICSKALVDLFIKRTRCSCNCKFPLVALKAKLNNCPLIKIDIHRPF